MQSKKRRLFALFLMLSMLMSIIQPAFAAQTTDSAEVNGTGYATLQEAAAAAPEGATVKVLKDITLGADNRTVSLTNSISLDLNGHTILGAGGSVLSVPAGKQLTIADSSAAQNGQIIGQQLTAPATADETAAAVTVEKQGQLTVTAGRLVGQVITGDTQYADGRAVQSKGTVTVTGGQLVGVKVEGNLLASTGVFGAYGIWNNMALTTVKGNAQVVGLEITGSAPSGSCAAVLSRNAVTVAENAKLYGTLFLNQGAVQSNDFASSAVYVQMGSKDVTVSGNAQLYAVKDASSVKSSSCFALNYAASGSVTVSGGVLNTMGGAAVNMNSGKQLTVSGNASLTSENGGCVALYGDSTVLAISGGLFQSEHAYRAANIEDYRAAKSAGVTGGVFNHAFAEGENAPALLAENVRTQRGTLADGVWTPSETGTQYKVGENTPEPQPQGKIKITFVIDQASYTNDNNTTHVTVPKSVNPTTAFPDSQLTFQKRPSFYQVKGTGRLVSYSIDDNTSLKAAGLDVPNLKIVNSSSAALALSDHYTWVSQDNMVCNEDTVFTKDTTLHLNCFKQDGRDQLDVIFTSDAEGTHYVSFPWGPNLMLGQSLAANGIPSQQYMQSEFPGKGTFRGWKLKNQSTGAFVDFTAGTPITREYVTELVGQNYSTQYRAIVYPVWDESVIPPVETVTATFMNGSQTVATRTLDKGAALGTLPTVTAPEGQVFKGWKAPDGTMVTAQTTISADTTYTAVFEAKPAELFTVAGSSVVLGNSLRIKFAVNVADLKGNTNVYALVTKNYADGTKPLTEQVDYNDWTAVEDGRRCVVADQIAAKEMVDEITVQIFDKTSKAPLSKVYSTSIQQYARKLLDFPKYQNNQALRTLLVDMLNYGTAAQNTFNYNTQNPANEILTPAEKALATQKTSAADHRVVGPNYYATTLSLDSNIVLNLYFRNITPAMEAEVTYTDHAGNPQKFIVHASEFQNSGTSGVMIVPVCPEPMALTDSRQLVTCVVKDGTKVVAQVSDSVESYAARALKSPNASPALKDLMNQMMKFVDSSTAYFKTLNK